jgi:hypothetical protein
LSDSSNYEKLKLFSEPNIIIYEGFFDELNKNLSVLKWEENLISEKDEIIILFSKPIEVLNNIFYSISNTYKKEKNKLGCIFPISMHNDKTIFSSGIEFLINNESKVQINIIDLGSFYNVLNGYKKSNFGSLSDIIATTPTILKKFDWLEVRHNTPIFFNYFATKCTENKLNVFVDTNAICTQLSFSNDNSKEKLNGDFQDLLTYINSKENLQKLLIKYQ